VRRASGNAWVSDTPKVIFLGDGGVGKSTLMIKKTTNRFEPRYLSTMGCEVTETTQYQIPISIWDTAGQERFGGLKTGYYKDSDLGVIFYDCTSKITFKNLQFWIDEYKSVMPNAPIIIVRTK
jgi:GTP-binding nuclear protein Ran